MKKEQVTITLDEVNLDYAIEALAQKVSEHLELARAASARGDVQMAKWQDSFAAKFSKIYYEFCDARRDAAKS